MLKITDELIARTSESAKMSGRKRMNHNFHQTLADPVQRLLNAAEPGTYVRPHKHEDPDKTEVFIILRGRVLVAEYDDSGRVTEHVILDANGPSKGVELKPRVWHSFISLESGSCLYEVKEGPFVPHTDKNFAPWSPEENSAESMKFIKKVLSGLDIR